MEPTIRLDQTYRFGLCGCGCAPGPAPAVRSFERLRFGLPAPPATA